MSASHSRTVVSALPEAMRCPSGLNATLYTAFVWPVSGWPRAWPVSASHSRTRLVALPETMRCPSGLNATLGHRVRVAGERLADGLAGVGVPQPHRLVATAGDDALAVGAERHAPHRVRVAGERLADGLAGVGVPQPHRLVATAGDDAVPSGLNATLHTTSVWPVSGWPTGWPVSASHSRTVLSSLAGGDAVAVGAERHAGYSRRCVDDLECVDPLHQRS